MRSKIVIIGGGAAGLVAAISVAEHSKDTEIIILERKDRVGKKILATGNGRCNLTNLDIDKSNYYGDDFKLIENVLNEYSPEKIISFFESIGVMCKAEDGLVYPYSNTASSVLTCLRNRLIQLRVQEITDFDVDLINKNKKNKYKIISKDSKVVDADKIIIATGGCSYENLGSNGSGFKILETLGHTCTKLAPALVQLKTQENLKSLKGVKFKGLATIKHKAKVLDQENGEILFTDYGLSGIAIMQLSRYTRQYNNHLVITLDFFPEYTEDGIIDMLKARKENLKDLDIDNFFIGMLNKNLGQVLLKKIGIERFTLKNSDLTSKQIKELARILKNFELKIVGTNGFKNAQVTAGGILTTEFDINTLESRINKNIYVAGEVLDVFGDCGGYNLHFAWATGLRAGHSAATKGSNL